MKKYKAYIPVVSIILLFAALVIFREDMIKYISNSMTSQMSENEKTTMSDTISKLYDYKENGKSFNYTFLEFGSTGCNACRQMESVMQTISSKYPNEVNVVFINVAQKVNKSIVNYYGIATIPTQILLDKRGKEFYRHNGYLSTDELIEYFRLH